MHGRHQASHCCRCQGKWAGRQNMGAAAVCCCRHWAEQQQRGGAKVQGRCRGELHAGALHKVSAVRGRCDACGSNSSHALVAGAGCGDMLPCRPGIATFACSFYCRHIASGSFVWSLSLAVHQSDQCAAAQSCSAHGKTMTAVHRARAAPCYTATHFCLSCRNAGDVAPFTLRAYGAHAMQVEQLPSPLSLVIGGDCK